MPGIVLTLGHHHANTLTELYTHINKKLKKNVILTDKVPHISLMRIQRDFTQQTLDTIEKVVNNISVHNIPLQINSIGMFKKTDSKFVLFFNTVYDANLKHIHKKVWDSLSNDMDLLEQDYYSPSSFTPSRRVAG